MIDFVLIGANFIRQLQLFSVNQEVRTLTSEIGCISWQQNEVLLSHGKRVLDDLNFE
ncbi:hypothetical protein C1752_01631 [Acaryochloris thomasi RCC1774]|uniref:Uncharacterized protein n=1 Tax=Acaryochloris thomasi RCC1774 TaxID=1764569 RepID=A0A2W1JS47_9CYAN|nr:hypothetical protein C1752_01631 [Acaryochloris thomasi RCC1774]